MRPVVDLQLGARANPRNFTRGRRYCLERPTRGRRETEADDGPTVSCAEVGACDAPAAPVDGASAGCSDPGVDVTASAPHPAPRQRAAADLPVPRLPNRPVPARPHGALHFPAAPGAVARYGSHRHQASAAKVLKTSLTSSAIYLISLSASPLNTALMPSKIPDGETRSQRSRMAS